MNYRGKNGVKKKKKSTHKEIRGKKKKNVRQKIGYLNILPVLMVNSICIIIILYTSYWI